MAALRRSVDAVLAPRRAKPSAVQQCVPGHQRKMAGRLHAAEEKGLASYRSLIAFSLQKSGCDLRSYALLSLCCSRSSCP